MRIRIVYAVMLLLLIFGFTGTSIGEPKTEDEARKAYIDASEESWTANETRQDTYEAYNESHKAEMLLDSLLGDINLENSDNWEDLAEDAVDILDAVGADPLDAITDAAAAVLKGLKDGWDWWTIRGKKNEIESALSDQRGNTSMLKSAWQSAKRKAKLASDKRQKAYATWKSFTPLAYSLHAPRTSLAGESASCLFKMNKAYEWVKWYVKSPNETGLGSLSETDTANGSPTLAFFTFTASESGDYVITATAKVASSGEEVSDSSTITVEPVGIFFDKTVLTAYDTLNVTIRKPRLRRATMYIITEIGNGISVDSGTASFGKVINLSTSFSSKWSGFYGMVLIEYECYKDDYSTDTVTENYYQYISVD